MANAFEPVVSFSIRSRLAIPEVYKGIANTTNFRTRNRVALVDGFRDRQEVVYEGKGKETRVDRVVIEGKDPRDGIDTVPGMQLDSYADLNGFPRIRHTSTYLPNLAPETVTGLGRGRDEVFTLRETMSVVWVLMIDKVFFTGLSWFSTDRQPLRYPKQDLCRN